MPTRIAEMFYEDGFTLREIATIEKLEVDEVIAKLKRQAPKYLKSFNETH